MLTKDKVFLSQMDQVDQYFLRLIAPKNMDGMSASNIIIQNKKEFENLCVILIDSGVSDPAKMSIFRFYSTLKYHESKKPKGSKATGRKN